MAFPLALLLASLAGGGLGTLFGNQLGSLFGGTGNQNNMNRFGDSGFSSVPGGGQLGSFSTLNPNQQQLQNQLLALLSDQLGTPNNDPISQNTQRQFQQQGLPSLLERFTQGGSTLQGSGFRNAAINAQGDLSSQLGAQRYQSLQNLLGAGLSPSTNQIYVPREQNAFEGLLKGLSGSLGSSIPMFAAQYGLGRKF